MGERPDPESADPRHTILHASSVAESGRAVLITGASGRGKSALALQLMGYGAALVADDRTQVTRRGAALIARAPDTIKGMIEARGVGILHASALTEAEVALVVDLDREETDRLPHPRQIVLLGQSVPLLLRVDAPHFAAAVLQFLRNGRKA